MLTHNSLDKSALFGLGTLYGEIGSFSECFDVLNKTISSHPDFASGFLNMAYYLNEYGKFDEALRYARDGLEIAKDSSDIALLLNNIGYSNLKLGNIGEALTNINRALTYDNSNAFIYRNKALYYLANSDKRSACKELFKARELGGINITNNLIKENCK